LATFRAEEKIDLPLSDIDSDGFMVKTDLSKASLACQVLPKLFPKVAFLILNAPQLVQQSLAPMLAAWTPYLNTLIVYTMPKTNQVPENFWPCIATLNHLEKLFFVRMFESTMPTPMPILPQLQQFGIAYYTDDVLPILHQ